MKSFIQYISEAEKEEEKGKYGVAYLGVKPSKTSRLPHPLNKLALGFSKWHNDMSVDEPGRHRSQAQKDWIRINKYQRLMKKRKESKNRADWTTVTNAAT